MGLLNNIFGPSKSERMQTTEINFQKFQIQQAMITQRAQIAANTAVAFKSLSTELQVANLNFAQFALAESNNHVETMAQIEVEREQANSIDSTDFLV